jgi:superoxide dismutase, Fe-Mn family
MRCIPVSNGVTIVTREEIMRALTRRHALLGAAAIGATIVTRHAFAQTTTPGPFTLPPLPYPPEANEPHIDAQTMQIHHDRHHAAYVTNLNAAVKDHPQVAAMGLSGMLGKLGELPDAIRAAVRNNGGGHANHSMFWPLMGGKGGAPSGDLAAAIDRDFGSLDKLKEAVNRAGLTQFGSGWTMVSVDRAGKLTVLNRPNQDTPLMDGGRVLFGNDVWEHAYYLKYQNRRADYLAAWWNVVNWPEVAKRYDAARAGKLDI